MSGMAAAGYPLPCTFSPLHWHVNMNGFSALARAWAGTGRRARPVCAESGLSAEAICRGHRPHSKNRLRENVGLTMYIKRPDILTLTSPLAHMPDYLRPLELPVHIGSSTNTWGPLKPSRMWSFDVVAGGLKLNRFCPQLPGKHCSLGQRVSGDS